MMLLKEKGPRKRRYNRKPYTKKDSEGYYKLDERMPEEFALVEFKDVNGMKRNGWISCARICGIRVRELSKIVAWRRMQDSDT